MHRSSTEPATLHRPGGFETAARIGSLHEVAPDIAGLRQLMVNVYFIGEPGSAEWTLVDAGLYGSAGPILREVAKRFGPDAKPRNILLTHGHFDHVGALETLAHHWQVDVFAHSLELPYLTGRSSYPPPDPTVGGGAMPGCLRFIRSGRSIFLDSLGRCRTMVPFRVWRNGAG